VHRVIAELWDDDPQETFQAARRLFASGADRHDIIHTLAEPPPQAARPAPPPQAARPAPPPQAARPAPPPQAAR
jgi:hypothetical protein